MGEPVGREPSGRLHHLVVRNLIPVQGCKFQFCNARIDSVDFGAELDVGEVQPFAHASPDRVDHVAHVLVAGRHLDSALL